VDRAVDLERWRESVMPSTAEPVVKKGLATMPVKFGISFNLPR
jgi:xanthine dehydrogenase large subunit